LDVETYGEDALSPWAGDISLLSLAVKDHEPWILDLRAIGYDLGELKGAIESAKVIAQNAKFDLLWLRVKCGLHVPKVFCTLTAARLLTAGTDQGMSRRQAPGPPVCLGPWPAFPTLSETSPRAVWSGSASRTPRPPVGGFTITARCLSVARTT